MGRPKAASSSSASKKPKQKQKQKQRGGVDFKKYRHKVGRKLPPAKNATDTQIKSKAIVLPEQSMASERTGMAVNKRGLTLRELLQQTAHYNANVRKAGLHGIKDIIIRHPSELKLHKAAVVEKLQERICDTDKVVRETLYNILQSLIFPSLKEDNAISTRSRLLLLMANILNGMTHSYMDVQLMAFKFLELVVLNFPSSFPTYAEQVLNNYVSILGSEMIYLQDKSKLSSVLSGLGHCLALVAGTRGSNDTSNRLVHNFVADGLANSTIIDENNSGSRFSSIKTKLEDLVQVLINSVEISASELCANATNAQSSEALLSAIHCLNLICGIFIHEMKKHQTKIGILKLQTYGPDWLRSSIVVHLKKLWGVKYLFHEKGDDKFFIFNVKVAEIFLCLTEWIDATTIPAEDFCHFIFSLLRKAKMLRNKELMEKHLGPIITNIPGFISNATGDFKGLLLEAFTDAFKDCKVDCKLITVYLAAIEEMLLPEKSGNWFADNDPGLLEYRSSWIDELPGILLRSVDKDLSVTKAVLELLLQIGQQFPAMEFNNFQPFMKFFGAKTSSGTIQPGPFVRLPCECQELAISCLYYFSSLLPEIMESLAFCCLRDELEPFILFRIVEVLQSAYRAGRLQITEQLGFLLLLVAQFKVHPGALDTQENDRKVSNWSTFKSLSDIILTCISQMGDGSLVLELMWNHLYSEIARNPPLHNMNALFRIIVALNARTAMLANEHIIKLIAGYLVDAALDLSKTIELGFQSEKARLFQYFIRPCIFMFRGNDKVLCRMLELLKSFAMGEVHLDSSISDLNYPGELSRRVSVITTILVFLYNDRKLHKNLSLSKLAMKGILQCIRNQQDSNSPEVTYDAKQKLHYAFELLKTKAFQLDCWDRSELEGLSNTT